MFRKIVLPIIATMLAALSLSGTVLAAEGDGQDLIKARGEISAVDAGAGKFRLQTQDGSELTLFVDQDTLFLGLEGLGELQVGWKAGVAAKEQDGKLWAVRVIAGDLSDRLQARGKVIDLNTAAGKFSIQTPDGEELRFFVDESTRYFGGVKSLDELEVGMSAGVSYTEQSQGKLIAKGLVAGTAPDLIKVKGEVTAVDPQLGKFEIQTPDGERTRFFTDERTRYQGQLSSLEELEVGWQAGVAAKEGEDGKLTAVLVLAGQRPEQVRSQGVIVSVDVQAGKFRLEGSDGSVLTFQTNQDTVYRGKAGSLDELEEGTRAGVGGYEDPEGSLIARVVIAGNPPEERPEIVRAQGTVKTVSPGAGKFQLEKSDGTVLTVYIDSKTNYRGQIASFEDLEKGMRAGFIGYKDSDGKLIARVVLAGNPPSQHREAEREAPEGVRPPQEPLQIPTT